MWSMKKPAIAKLVVIQHWKMRYLKLLNLKKNVDIDKYKYFGYRIGFDRHEDFHILIEEMKNM